ncbi:MAG: pyrroline-5-carboxylate reductase [Chromatiales bacterium]|nr:pyrroline-5-carboxylate reductase [Chromatiales bacterium]
MTEELQITGFIGGGNMAGAMIRGLLAAGRPASSIVVAEPLAEQRERLQALDSGLCVTADNLEAATRAGMLVLAVKPQLLDDVLVPLAAADRPAGQLVVSVAAGITLGRLARHLGRDMAIVRVMPNQPALVGAGVSALCASPGTSTAQRREVEALASAMGTAIWLDDETQMDAVTAISGSGPAYFYLLIEMLEQAGTELGLPAPLARQLAVGTALGAGQAAASLKLPPDALRASVTSPGGTTAAALEVLESRGVRSAFAAALRAARDRSLALGRSD